MKKLEQILGETGPYLSIALSLVPIYFWLPFASWDTPSAIFRSAGQITALIGTVLFCIDFILATRWTVIEYLFMGLNRAYIFHHIVGAVSFVLLMFHPLFLIVSYVFISLQAAVNLILPTVSNIPIFVGTAALIVMMVLLLITFFVNMEYDAWKRTHIWLGLALALGTAHSILIGSTIEQSQGLRMFMYSMSALALISLAYRIYRKYIRPAVYSYLVQDIHINPGATFLNLSPVNEPMKFVPGQFAFLTFLHKGIPKESHPFSIVNAPNVGTLTFAAKSFGDYTETLKLLEPNSPVRVEGPYGRFSYTYLNSMRYVWIAGGIGVTPFLSMLLSLKTDHKFSIDFFYCVKDEHEALYINDIQNRIALIPNVRFTLWTSKTMGRFDINVLERKVPDFNTATFMLCGPPAMMGGLKSQMVALGIKKRRIISEEFALQ